MRTRVIALAVVCLFTALIANGQKINEAESSLLLSERSGEFLLQIENEGDKIDTKLKLELLDQSGKVRASLEKELRIKRGKKRYRVEMPLGGLLKTVDNGFLWYRVRYSLGESRGILSLSELVKDIFEVRVAAAHFVKAGQNYRVRVRTFDSKNELPVRKVSVQGTLNLDIDTDSDNDDAEIVVTANGTTDRKGFAVLDFKVPDGARLDDAELTVIGRKNGIVAEVEESLDTPEEMGSLLMTIDKPIYQPGQKFNVRALFFHSNENVLPETELEFKIKDEEDTLLYRETVNTSEYGIASIAWSIPENAKLGNYKVEVEADGEIRGNEQSFKVTRYDLPKFKVEAKPDKTFYLPKDKKASITISADYLFGKPVTTGKVRVVQESDRTWNWRKQKYDIDEDRSVEGVADENGKYIAEFDLGKDKRALQRSSWRRFTDLTFAAYFTDLTTNRTEQRRFDIRLSKEPIHIYLSGKTYGQNPKLPITLYVSTFYADGSPAVCDLLIEGRGEKDYAEDFKKLTRIKTNSLGAGKLEFKNPISRNSRRDLDIKITARDKKSRLGNFDEEISFDNNDGIKIAAVKTIYKPGEDIEIEIFSTKRDALVYIDIVKEWSAIDSHFVLMKRGKGSIKIPYRKDFNGDLTVSAYFERVDSDGDLDLIRTTSGIIFPEQKNLNVDAKFSNASYKPSEEATVDFSVLGGNGKPLESALGVVVFDKAIEERARTDAQFGSYFSRFFGWLGYSKSFGGITLKDLNDLNLSKPISPDMQLAAEAMLSNSYYYPEISRSEFDHQRAKFIFSKVLTKQFAPIEKALREKYEKDFEFPRDDRSLIAMLGSSGISFEEMRDPWGQKYRVNYLIDRKRVHIKFITAGPDKKFSTRDDFTVTDYGFNYFRKFGEAINRTVKEHHEKTGLFIRGYRALKAELSKRDINLDNIRDPWNRRYQINFEVSGRFYLIRFASAGANGKFEERSYYRDDFDAWKVYTDYFAKTELEVNRILSENVNSGKTPFPRSAEDFNKMLEAEGFPITQIKDGFGREPYVSHHTEKRYSDRTVVKDSKTEITPVTQEIAFITIRSKGKDSLRETADDFDLAKFFSVITEQYKGMLSAKAIVKYTTFSGSKGAIRGTVADATGAVIPGAVVSIESAGNSISRSVTSNDVGAFLFENLPSGLYTVKANASGFATAVHTNIRVTSQSLTEMQITLESGDVTATVDVTSNQEYTIDGSSSSMSTMIVDGVSVGEGSGSGEGNGIGSVTGSGGGGRKKQKNSRGGSQNATPRLRKYFPETLVWNPEIITDKNGKASLKFKMADNITTWKLYTVASTKNGKIGIAEREVQSFQPFFVDLEPPKFLTQGDEIHLPSQIRNYTDSKQKVSVTMAQSDWFSFLPTKTITKISATDANTQKIEVASNGSENAVFGFRADKFIKKGKQRVTAIAEKESDAIEKPVTVRPNGHEVIKTASKLFRHKAEFDVNFPANAIGDTPTAELKIYPNLLAHVAESVEGLLQRPYGCGEQTISSTYPNLMILKFTPKENKLRKTAQKYLQKGYERLLGYQVSSGGFAYWGGSESADIALTAYAIRFLKDAKSFVAVDDTAITKAERWLVSKQRVDGSWVNTYRWERSENPQRTKMLTSYIARTLSMVSDKRDETKTLNNSSESLKLALDYLKKRNAEIDEPYSLALYGLAALGDDDLNEAKIISAKLADMAIAEGNGAYWKLETNTPFYGWGKAGRIETTALVLQLLTKVSQEQANKETEDLIARGTQFLLKKKDRYGVWYSTQTTINVLDAFLTTLGSNDKTSKKSKVATRTAEIFVNGEKVKSISLPAKNEMANPMNLDLSSLLTPQNNRVEIKTNDNTSVMSQVVQNHYVEWKDAEISKYDVTNSRQIKLDYECDQTQVKVMDEVTCEVKAERVGFRGYGMLLAEIGIPPGADVSRESLQNALESDWSFSKYDILPDRIVVYMWAKAGGTNFKFKFKPRYGINAQTPASTVYDYYNEEARATIAPMRFEVR